MEERGKREREREEGTSGRGRLDKRGEEKREAERGERCWGIGSAESGVMREWEDERVAYTQVGSTEVRMTGGLDDEGKRSKTAPRDEDWGKSLVWYKSHNNASHKFI